MNPRKHPAQPYLVNWTAWGTLAAALMPMAQVSPPLRLFAVVALFFGGMFFLYALKYYVSMALILVANGNGNGNGNGAASSLFNGTGNGHGLRSLARNGEHNDKLPHRPFISIHLPLYNEASVVDRLLQSCTNLSYEHYEVVVADDSSDETIAILDQRWAPHPRVKISRRHDRSGFKGGALEKALEITDPRAEFIAVFDADFIPPPDILQQFLAYFYGVNGNGNGHGDDESDHPQLVDDRLAVVQGYQWHILNASENWITRGIRTEFSGSYVIERSSQELLGAMKMISGSVFMIRADVLRQHGWGTSITEDWELTLRLYLSGYKVLYTPFIQAPSECVATFKQLARQRMRWAEGHTFNVKKFFLDILSSPNIDLTEKLEFIYYAPYYLQSVFFILGTSAWLMSEVVLRQRLPMLPATIGWALVFTNALSLVLMNLTGLFMERGVRRNWSGLFSFVLLTYLLVPYQAYAALKGLLEPHEGGWHRTQKTGIITDVVDKLGLGKRMKRLLPKQRRSGKTKSGGIDVGRRLGGLPVSQIAQRVPAPVRKRFLNLSPGLRLASGLAAVLLLVGMGIVVISDAQFAPDLAAAAVFVPIFAALATERRRIGTRIISVVISVLLALTLLALQVAPVVAAPDAFYLHDNPLADGRDMDGAQGTVGASLAFNSIGQTAYWYTGQTYPSGSDDANLTAGSHTLTLYFGSLPGAGESLDLTLGVYHTRPDGSDPQLITSTTTTIDSATSNPLTLDLGLGSAETFTQADPRRLRVTVEVDDIQLGGSFALNFDSAAAPSALETPSLTVLDPALLLALAAVFIPIVTALVTQRRTLASRMISLALAIIIALALLSTQVQVVTAAPDAFYLHPVAVNDGEQLTSLIGSGASTLTFDTISQTTRWYTELDYPAGGDDATISAGSYTFNMYFDQLPGNGWWDSDYAYRKQITVSTGSEAVGAGYSASLTFNHEQLVTDGKAEDTGVDLRVVHFDGTSWSELDRVVDIHSSWNWLDTEIWFQLQDPIPANDSDSSYYIYYGNPSAGAPPEDPMGVFTLGEAFDDGALVFDLVVATAGVGTATEDLGFQEMVIDTPATSDAAIVLAESSLSFSRQFSVRHRTKLEIGTPEATLLGIVEDAFEPDVTDSATEDARQRIMVTHDGDSDPGDVYVFYKNDTDTPIYWDGSAWSATFASADQWFLNDYHTLELFSDGTQWWIELRSEWGTLLQTTDPVLWSDVQDLGDDFWFYWGDPSDDQLSLFQSSNWVSLRDYVDPEPTSGLGGEQTPSSVYADLTISVHHTDSDGSNPVPIVSQSTTIDAQTSNPLVLDLGSAAEQTFSSGNPQKLRLQITVDDLAAGADFVLAYDSAADPSRLETPSLTVLDPALILTLAAILVPVITAMMTERRRMATRLISVIISILLALALLATQVAPVVAAPDSFYLHDADTSGISPSGEVMSTDAPTDPAPPAEFPAGPNYRSIGTDTGTLYSAGNASINSGETTVTFGGGASLPAPTAVGAVGSGDKLVIGSETFFILSRVGDTQVTVQNAAASTHTNEAYSITRAYNSFQGWEDPCGATPCLPTSSGGRGGDLVGENRAEIGVAYKDGVFSPTGTTTINDSTTDASYYMGLTVAVGQRHSGVAGGGVIVDGGSIASSHMFHIRDGFFRLEWLEIRNYPGDTAGGNPINVEEAEAPNSYLSHLIIHDYTDNSRGAINIYDDTTVRNSIFYNGVNGIRSYGGDNPQVTLENLTIYNMSGDGIRAQTAGNYTFKNIISVGSTGGQDFDIDDAGVVIDPSSGYNLYGDVQSSVHPGSNNQSPPASLDDLFVSTVGGSENLHLEPGGHAAIDNGVSLAGSFTVDVDNQTRPYRAAWDIGADEHLPYVRFDTVSQDAYWYSDLTYPTGGDSGSIASGDYILNMYFAKLPATGSSVSITVSVAKVESDGTPVNTIVSTSTTIDSNTANPLALNLGTGAAQSFDPGADERLQVQIHVDSIGGGGSFSLAYDSPSDPSSLETPVLTVPDFTLVFAVLAALIPMVTYILTNRRRRRLAARLISLAVSLLIALSLLSQDVMTAVAAPDSFYLHDTATGGGNVSHVETQTTAQTTSSSYGLPSVAGGTDQLYLVAVAIYRDSGSSATVSSISGGGLSWSFQVAQCSARIPNPRIEIWQAYGSPSSFTATVNLGGGAVRRSSAAISSYSGADPTTPTEGADGSNYMGQPGPCGTGITDTDAASLSLTSSQNDSVLYAATQPRNRTITTPDPDYAERAFVSNTSGGDGANLYVHDRTLAATGSDSADHTLSGATDWDMAGLVINPGSGVSPAGQLMDSLVGSSPATLNFDTVDQEAYWYSDISYPTGQDNASIAAGSYTFNAYLSSLPGSGLLSKVETFAANSGTGNQTISSTGFQPKAVLFWVTDQTATGSAANARFGRGWTDGTNQAAAATAWQDGTDSTWGSMATDRAILLIDETGSVLAEASIVSLNSDGFTINWTTAGGSRLVTYLALGGPALTNVKVGTKTLDQLNSTEPVTGLGFQPDGVLLFGARDNALDFGDTQEGHAFGVALSPTDRHSSAHRERSNGNGRSGYREDQALATADDLGPPEAEWDLQSMDADGFTLVPDLPENVVMSYLALEGVSIGRGILTQPTSTGNQSVTSLSFTPSVVMFDGGDKAAVADYEDEPEMVHGVATSASERAAIWIGRNGTAADTHMTTFGVLRSLTAGTPSVNAAADFVSMNSNGFTIDWSSADATLRKVGWVALGPAETSVDITVSVHHTAADGSDPQLITQTSTTIDGGTGSSLVLDLGSAGPQTFNSGDPRLLRVQVHVDQIAGGASFVLDYDSAADPSSLETPSLVVPEISLIFTVLAVVIPLLTATLTMNRRKAVRLISVMISLTVALSMLATQVTTVTAAPDVYYLHDSSAGSGAGWYDPDWGYRNKITIDNTKVSGSSDLSYFPVLVSMTESEWADSANGGKVDQADGGDILFTASDGTTKLDHEIESYDNTDGTLVAWVEVPTVSYNGDTDIYIYYGNTTGVVDQWNINGTWDENGANNFKAVWHLDEDASGTGTADLYQDSTSFNNHGDDQVSATGQSGQINGGQQFDGSTDLIPAPDYDVLGAITISTWINRSSIVASEGVISKRTSSEVAGDWALRFDNSDPNVLEWMVWSGVDSSQSVLSNTNIGTGAWTYVVLTFDDPSNSASFYLNGSPDGGGSISNGLADTPEQIYVGNEGQGDTLNGYLDEVRIANVIRDADWIQTEYNNQFSPSTFIKPLGQQETSGLSPAGKLMNTTQGSSPAMLTFDTVDQEAYWYSELSYPTGADNASIAAGNYTANLYFNSLPSGGAFPVVEATNTSNTTTAATSHTVNLPAGVQSGDLLIVMLGGYIGSGSTPIDISWPAGWTEFYEQDATSGTLHLAVSGAYRKADGTEGSSVTASTNLAVLASHNTYRVSGAADPAVQPPEVASVPFIDQSGTTVDPPSLAPTGGAKNYLWLAVAGWRRTGRTLVSGPPNYSDSIDIQSTGGAEGLHLASARRQFNAASEDPGVFTLSSNSERKIGATIAVHPAASSVDITVSVHHTKEDGSDPQLITSASTTIDSGTTDPLALDLGSAAEQTFTAADPRLLRVQVTVDSIIGAGSFVLDFDSAANPSSLDTPVVTVPEWGAAFVVLIPLVPYLMAAIWRRRRLAGSIATVLLGAIVAISMLATQVVPTTAAPDVFYLHTDPTSGLSPAGEYMDMLEGTGGSFDTGTGADGSVTLSGFGNLNTQILGSSRAGSPDGIATAVTANPTGSSISVASSTGFATGDEILLINLQGALGDTADVGTYEFLEVASVPDSTTINVTSSVANSYDGTTFANQSVVVQRVPQWTSVTINSGGILTASAWDGTTGGIVIFRATGTVTVNTGGSITATGLGYRGGAGGVADGGSNGESYDGQNGKGGADGLAGTLGGGSGENHPTQDNTSGTRGGGGGGGETGSIGEGGAGGAGGGYGGAGGGGGGGSDTANYISGSGGAGGTTGDSAGGGGHGENSGTSGNGGDAGTPGVDGGVSVAVGGGLAGSGATTGQGGHSEDASDSPGGGGGGGGTYGVADLSQIFLGSGGGGGGDSGAVAGNGETGGDGGGIIFIIADTVNVISKIDSDGADGITATDGDGASGGGAGGSIMIQANSVDNSSGNMTATGGTGGARDVNDDAGGGGGGGVGRIRIEADTITGSTTPAASTAGTPGGGTPSKTFNSVGNTYWYHDVAWPTGNDDAIIASGDYTFNMYFGSLPSGSSWYDGNWLYRKQITVQSAEVDANVTQFPVYMDLADLGSDFFANVRSDGGDIRVTTSDGQTELPREVVAIDTGAETGELHFRADSLSSSTNTSFYIYYGNSGASDYAVTATYGRNAVWSNGYAAVWHLEEEIGGTGTSGLYVDSTSNGYNGDDQVSATGQTGRLGAGQQLDGSDDYIDMGDVLDFPDPAGFTLESWIRPTIPGAGSLQVSGTPAHTTFDFSGGSPVSFPYTTPAGSDRLMLVAVSMVPSTDERITSVTYNSDPLTFIAAVDNQNSGGDDARVEIWALVAPDVGSNLTLELAISPIGIVDGAVVGVVTLTGADQVLPDAADFASNWGAIGPATVDVASTSGELVFAAAACETCTSLTPVSVTEHWNDVNPGGRAFGAGATKAGAATTTMQWSMGSNDYWAIGAIPIRPAPGSLSDQMTFISKWGGTGSDRNYRFEVETDSTLTFLPGGGVDPLLNSTTVMSSDTWYHAAVNVRPSSDTIRLLMNGTEEDTATSWTGAIGDGTYAFNLGRRADVSQWFNGYLDEVRVSDVSRNGGWVETSYNNQFSTSAFYQVAGQEGYQAVDITVYVEHTDVTGGNAVEITSASTTINADTASFLAFDLGNDPVGQSFESTNQRVLRLRVQVAGVTNGGSFTLDYDGPCASNACSSLDTPVVTVPEFALIFGALAVLVPPAMAQLWRRGRERKR